MPVHSLRVLPFRQLGKVAAAADRPYMIRYRDAGEGLRRQQGKSETLACP